MRRDSGIRALEKAIDDERRKSMADEEKIRHLEQILAGKVEEASRHYENYNAVQEKYELSAEEIERLK